MRAKKSLGQNFLMHPQIAERITEAARLTPEDTVLEIGPGTGMLTRPLLARAARVIAVEADTELFSLLQKTFAPEVASGKLELILGDIRAFDLATLSQGYALVANIPYYLTGEIFRKFLEAPNQPSAMTLLVQKEVAERICRAKKENILSLSVKAYGEPEYLFTVPRGAFKPAPTVDSALLAVRNISRENFSSPGAERRFFALVRAGFAHKRKFLASNLKKAGFDTSSVPAKARAEDLALSDWLTLSRAQIIEKPAIA